jgi:hypothetical protein
MLLPDRKMNTQPTKDQNDRLTRLLNDWRLDANLPPRFQESVWQRIARAESGGGPSFLAQLWRAIDSTFRRPVPAVAYVTVLVAIGLSAGMLRARETTSRLDHTLETRYLQSVDPYLQAR